MPTLTANIFAAATDRTNKAVYLNKMSMHWANLLILLFMFHAMHGVQKGQFWNACCG